MRKFLLFMSIFLLSFPNLAISNSFKFLEHKYDYKLNDVLKADKFEKKAGYWEGYKDNKLAGYVLLSKDWAARHVGYSGKHMETLIGFDTKGIVTGVKILYHCEPIVLIGLDEKRYNDYINQYIGKSILSNLTIGKEISMDAITGATVTAVVQNAIITESSMRTAYAAGLMKSSAGAGGRTLKEDTVNMTWDELISSGGVKNIKVSREEAGESGGGEYLDLYYGLVTQHSIGTSILGKDGFNVIKSKENPVDHAIFVVANGEGSFKGSGYVRGGVFDRISVEQEGRVYVFTDRDYSILTEIKAFGAPKIREGGVFIIRGKDFNPAAPFKFRLVLTYRTGAKKNFKSFISDYTLSDKFLK